MNKPSYSIQVWGQQSVEGQARLQEYMICEIGSDTMAYRGRALNAQLNQDITGEITLSFDMKTQWVEDAEKVDNPFIQYLVNDIIIKLRFNGDWYDFVLTQKEEESDNYTNSYTCTSADVYELSKTGYGLVFDSEINNNQGTALELASEVVSGTDWFVDEENSDTIYEKKKNALYKATLTQIINAEEVLTGTVKTLNMGTAIYVFYDDYISKADKVQFIYGEDEAQLDDINVVLNWTNYYIDTTWSNEKPNWATNIELVPTFEGYAYVLVDRLAYDSAIEEQVGIYQDDDENTYYRRTITEYASTDIVPNLSTNGTEFSIDDNGEVVGWTSVRARLGFKSYRGMNWLEAVPTSGSNYRLFNSGLIDNASLAGPITKGDKILVRCRLGEVEGGGLKNATHLSNYSITIRNDRIDSEGKQIEGDKTLARAVSFSTAHKNNIVAGRFTFTSGIPTSFTAFSSTATINNDTWLLDLSCADDESKQNGSYLYFYRLINGHFYQTSEGANVYWSKADGTWGDDIVWGSSEYFYIKRSNGQIQRTQGEFESDGSVLYRTINDPDCRNQIDNVWIVLTAEESVSASDIATDGYKIIFNSSTTDLALYIGDFYVSAYKEYQLTDVSDKYTTRLPIFVGSVPIGQSNTYYKFYDPEIVLNADDMVYIDDDIAASFKPVTNNYEKVRSIEASKSNRFNILQSICEQFEIWIKFTIEHNENGTIKLDENGNPIKKISFHNYIGDLNYAGFVYGINLKGITREITSEDIVSKLFVEPNTNEGADDGYCTIQKANSNTFGEEYIYNFNYYINKGLMGDTTKADIYKFYEKIGNLNNPVNQLIDQQALIQVQLTNAESRVNVYGLAVDSINEEIEVQRNKLLAWDDNIPQAYWEKPEASPFVQGAIVGKYYTNDGTTVTTIPDDAIVAIVETLNELKNRVATARENYTKATNEYNTLSAKLESIEDQLTQIQNDKVEIIDNFERKYSRYIREGSWQSEDYIDHELYYLDGLVVSETYGQPQVSYNISVVDVSAIEGLKPFTFKVGDKTTMEDPDFFGIGVKEEVIVSSIRWDLDNPQNDNITVRNYKTQFEDIFSRIEASVQTVEYHEGSYNRAASVVENKTLINSDVLTSSMKYLAAVGGSIDNSASQIYQDNTGITSMSKSASSKQMKLMDASLFTSTDGGRSWKKIISPEGIYVDYLNAGRIDTTQIQIINGDAALFLWNDTGINAYSTNGNYVDYAKFVRFDQFGLYGVDANSTLGTQYMLSYKFKPTSIDDVIDNNAVNFALTWDGFLLRSNQAGNLFTIDSETGLKFSYENGDGSIILGKTGNDEYGLKISGDDGAYLKATSTGIDIGNEVTVNSGLTMREVIEGQAVDVDTQYCITDSASIIPFPDTPVLPSGSDPATGWVSEVVQATSTDPFIWQRTSVKHFDVDTETYTYVYSGYQCLNPGNKEVEKIEEIYYLEYETFTEINACDVEYYARNVDVGSAQIDWTTTDPSSLTWVSTIAELGLDLQNRETGIETQIYRRTKYVALGVTDYTLPVILYVVPQNTTGSTTIKYYNITSKEYYRVYSGNDIGNPPAGYETYIVDNPWKEVYTKADLDVTKGNIYVWYQIKYDVERSVIADAADYETIVNYSVPDLAYNTETAFPTPQMPLGYQISNEYNKNTSTTTPPDEDDSGWHILRPPLSDNEELWVRSVYTNILTEEKTYKGYYCLSSATTIEGLINNWTTIPYSGIVPKYAKQYSCSQITYSDGTTILYGLDEAAFGNVSYYFKVTTSTTSPADYEEYALEGSGWTQEQPTIIAGQYVWRITVIYLKNNDGTESRYVTLPENITSTSGAAYLQNQIFGDFTTSMDFYYDLMGNQILDNNGNPIYVPRSSGGLKEALWNWFGLGTNDGLNSIPKKIDTITGDLSNLKTEVENINNETINNGIDVESIKNLITKWQTKNTTYSADEMINGAVISDGTIMAKQIATGAITITNLNTELQNALVVPLQYVKTTEIAKSILQGDNTISGTELGIEIGYFRENDSYKVFLSASGLYLFGNGEVVAYLTSNSLKIREAQILNRVIFGAKGDSISDYVFTPQTDGNLRIQVSQT